MDAFLLNGTLVACFTREFFIKNFHVILELFSVPHIGSRIYCSWEFFIKNSLIIFSNFLQVHLDPSCCNWFGFSVPDSLGNKRYFRYCRLPFGAAAAVQIVDSLIKPIKAFCHRYGCDLSVYIDDGIVIEITAIKCLISTYFCLHLLLLSGWSIKMAKCVLQPCNYITYLGFELNSIKMNISLPLLKVLKTELLIDNVLNAHAFQTPIPVRHLAQLLGTLAHAIHSHGSFVRLVSRNSNHNVGRCVSDFDWDASLVVSDDMARELTLCKTYFKTFNGQPLTHVQLKFDVMGPHQASYVLDHVNPADALKDVDIFVSGKI